MEAGNGTELTPLRSGLCNLANGLALFVASREVVEVVAELGVAEEALERKLLPMFKVLDVVGTSGPFLFTLPR